MSINERLKIARKRLSLTQEELGNILGVTKSRISVYEKDEDIPNRAIRTLCKELNINEIWLREGIEPMFREMTREEEIATYMGDLLSSDDEEKEFQKQFIKMLSKLDLEEWKTIEKMVNGIVNGNDK